MTLKKIARVGGLVVIILVALMILVQLFLAFYMQNKLEHVLKVKIAEESKGKYKIELGKTSVNIFTRSLECNSFAFIPSADNFGKKPKLAFIAAKLELNGIDLWSFFKSKKLFVKELRLESPQILIFQSNHVSEVDTVPEKSLYQAISKELKEISIGKIAIQDADLKIYNKERKKGPVLTSLENEIILKTFIINERSDSLQRHFLSENFYLRMRKCYYYPPGDLYSLEGTDVESSYHDSLLQVGSLKLIPLFSKDEFSEKAGEQVSRIDLILKKISFNTLHVQLFLERNWLVARSLNIAEMNLNVHRDKSIPLSKTKKESLQKIIRDIPFLIKLDTIRILNGNIEYEHLAAGKEEEGKVRFSKLKGTITGFNNSPNMDTKEEMILNASCMLMEKGNLEAQFRFPLNTNKEVFICKGKLSSMPLSAMNAMLLPAMNASIKEGTLDKLTFAFTADENEARGRMLFLYHGLKIQLRDKDGGSKKVMLSFLANAFVHDGNPGKDGKVRETEIRYSRYPYKFFFYYTWKALQSGIMPAIGINSEKMLKRSDSR